MTADNVHRLFPSSSHPTDSIPMRSVRGLDQVAEAARDAIGGALALNRLANSDLDSVSSAAQTAQVTLRRMIVPPTGRMTPPAARSVRRNCKDAVTPVNKSSLVMTPLFVWGRKIDMILTSLRRRGQRPQSRLSHMLSPVWSWVGLLITGIAAALLAAEHWLVAAGIVLVRVGISRWIGSEANHAQMRQDRDRSSSTIMYKCVAAHLCDCIMLLVVIWLLLTAGALQWAFVGVIAIITMLLGTLARVAALQVGVQVFRLTMERVFRTGSLAVALFLTALWQPTLPETGFPLLAIALLGCLVFGLGELVRTQHRVRHAVRVYGATPKVSITIKGKMTSTEPVKTGFREAS